MELRDKATRDFIRLLIASGVVVIGILFELPEVCREFRKWWRHKSAKNLIPVFSLAGLALVIFGVAGEAIYEGRVGIDDTNVRKIDDAAIKEAGDTASDAQGKVAILNLQAAQLNNEAETERLARMKLEAQIQPRSYTAAEISSIDKACKTSPGAAVVMRSMAYDVEGAVFGTYLAAILGGKDCGLKVNTSGVGDNFMQNLPMFMDVHVQGPPENQAFISSLVSALNTPHVRTLAEAATRPGSPVMIFVGAKRLSPPP